MTVSFLVRDRMPCACAHKVSGGLKPLTDGGRIPLAGVLLAALPTQTIAPLRPMFGRKKPTRFTGVGTAVRGVSILLGRVCKCAEVVSTHIFTTSIDLKSSG